MVNFYRRFIPNRAEVAASLTPLTGGQNGPIEMSTEQFAAFERLKSCLAKATTLTFPSPEAEKVSKALQPTEQRYSSTSARGV